MRLLVRVIGGLLALVVLVMGGTMVASETGEVVVFRTPDPATETRLWIVDEAGRQWLRAGNPQSSWLLAIQKSPSVEVERGGKPASYTAVPDVASRDRINALYASKYGLPDRFGWIR